MIIIIQRTTDKKYLQSIDTDTWVDNIKDAFELSYKECQLVKETLLLSYTQEQLKEIPNLQKIKPITKEEKKELLALIVK